MSNSEDIHESEVYFRYDPDLARFEDPPSVNKPNDEAAFKFCPSCVRVRQKELVCYDADILTCHL